MPTSTEPLRTLRAHERIAALLPAPAHFEHLKQSVPSWLREASPARRLSLKNNPGVHYQKAKAATAQQHGKLKTLIADHMAVQNAIDQKLAHVSDAQAFAEPLLKAAIQRRFGLELDVRETFLRLYVPLTNDLLPITTGVRTWTVSLLEAALHNFEENETKPDAYETGSMFITRPSPAGQFESLPLIAASMEIAAFAALCRELDIGARYQVYLEDNLGITNPVAAAVLHPKLLASQQSALRAALQLARMNGDLGADFFQMINGVLDGISGIRADGQALLCHDLTMMDTALTGIIVFAPDPERATRSVKVVAYIPDDPEHPVKEYASTIEMMKELTRQLRSPDYQGFFSRFVAHAQRGHFFSDLSRRLGQVTWHEHERGSELPTWRLAPIEQPNLQLSLTPISTDLWLHLYTQKLNQILNDGRVIAIATATVDRNARWALWDSFVNIASAILQAALFVVAPFVPGLGELMLAYMTWQLLDETFEGIVDWAQGRGLEAFGHFMSALESLIEAGTFVAGSAVVAGEYRQLLPAEVVTFIDRFNVVKTPSGQARYWEPDLAPYQREAPLPPHSRPDAAGLHSHDGQQILKLDDAHYTVVRDAQSGRQRIQHPTRADAYQPRLSYNDEGAWHTELERPLTWDSQTLLERLGTSVESLTPIRRAELLEVSGCSEDALRKMHIDEEPIPALLSDSAKRFVLDQALEQFARQIGSDAPEQFLQADPVTQLELLAREKRLPDDRKWDWIDDQGNVAWTSSDDKSLPLQPLHQAMLKDGDVLKTLLVALSESQVKSMLGEASDGTMTQLDVRTKNLRTITAQAARKHRSALFEERYRRDEIATEPLTKRFVELEPDLPTSMARAILDRASGKEQLQIDQGSVPDRLRALATLGRNEVRLTRAYEGLQLDSVHNPDTDRLALHSLSELNGWSDQIRLDIRDGSYGQPPLDGTGPLDGSMKKTLVRLADDRYQPYDEQGQSLSGTTDFYSSVLQALPDNERNALGIHIGQGEQLKQAIRKHALARDEFRTVLTGAPMTELPPETMHLLGTSGFPRRSGAASRTLKERVLEVYPNLEDQALEAMTLEMLAHPAGARIELGRRANEYAQLCIDLHAWVSDTPRFDPNGRRLTPAQFSAARQNRRLLKRAVKRCWRRESPNEYGHSLVVSEPISGNLPVLSADFSHVDVLSVAGSRETTGVDEFLSSFRRLRRLDLRDFSLGGLPPAIADQTVLEDLILSDCNIRLSVETRETLSSLTRLKTLDLFNNPLGFTLDFSRMPELEYVDLGSTGATEVPVGWITRDYLTTMVLNNNQITDLPASLFDLSTEKLDAIDVAANPLSTLCLERIKTVAARTGRDLGVLAPAQDIQRVRALYPTSDIEDASTFVYRLPGTLEQGRLEITRLETEYTTLTNDLSAWTADVPLTHPLTGQALDAAEDFIQQALREDFKNRLQACWRQETEMDNVNSTLDPMYEFYFAASMFGELPRVTANFDHVSVVHLESRHGLTTIGRFLEAFPNIKGLAIRHYALERIPQEVFSMGNLDALTLPQNQIQLDEMAVTALAGLDRLDILDLTDNPLGRAPDVSQMHSLSTLSLSHTGINEVPNGLFGLTGLDDANLSHNNIRELPFDYLELPATVAESFNFLNNPLSEATLQRLVSYYQRTGCDLGVIAVHQRAELEPGESTDSAEEE